MDRVVTDGHHRPSSRRTHCRPCLGMHHRDASSYGAVSDESIKDAQLTILWNVILLFVQNKQTRNTLHVTRRTTRNSDRVPSRSRKRNKTKERLLRPCVCACAHACAAMSSRPHNCERVERCAVSLTAVTSPSSAAAVRSGM